MIDYFILYLICVSGSLILPFLKYESDKKILFFFIAALLIVFSGIRYYVGWDFEVYQSLYDDIFNYQDPLAVIQLIRYQDFEFGFRLFSLSAIVSPYLPVFLSCLISVGVSFLIMYKSPSRILGVFVILYLWYEYFSVFNIQRQIIANAVILLGVYISVTCNKKRYLCVLAPIAFSFHVSSFLFFVFYFIILLLIERDFKLNLSQGVIAVSISVLLIALPIDMAFLIYRISAYMLSHFGSIGEHAALKLGYYFNYLNLYKTGFSFRYVEYIFVFLVSLYNKNKILRNIDSPYGENIFLLSLYMSAFHVLMYGVLSGLGVIQERVESYFLFMHVILASYLTLVVSKDIKRYLYVIIISSLFVFTKYYRLLESVSYIGADSHYQRFIPYESIFTDYK